MDTVLEKIRSVVLSTLAMLVILLVVLMLLNVGKASMDTTASYTNHNSTNAVTGALSAMVAQADATINDSMQTATDAMHTLGAATVSGITTIGRAITTSFTLMVHNIWQSFLFTARFIGSGNIALAQGIRSGFIFIGQTASAGVGLLGDAPSVSAMIRPSSTATVPTIDAALTTSRHIQQINQPVQTAHSAAPSTSAWPLHGAVTAHFGAPHWPYQPVHTGIDISSGHRSGVMAIKPFRSGIVIETVHSRYGLGNHVVIDHGGGVTSTYAHLYNIVVQIGQTVGVDTVVGHEGSTGISTGPHLHFEIHKDGRLQNPHDYIAGNP